MDRRQDFRADVIDYGLSEELADWALELALPRVELRPAGASPGPVVGRYGGHPELPADVEWSGYPHFVATVDCAALPPGAPDFPLPPDGHLLFFGNMDTPRNGAQGRVLYVPPGTPTAERRPAEEHAEFVTAPFALHGHVDWNMPSPGDDIIERDEERAEIYDEHHDVWIDNSDAGPLTLGGHACPAYDDPCLPPYPNGDPHPWRLLAQARTTPASRAPVENTIFWLIHPADLAASRFDRTRTELELVPPA